MLNGITQHRKCYMKGVLCGFIFLNPCDFFSFLSFFCEVCVFEHALGVLKLNLWSVSHSYRKQQTKLLRKHNSTYIQTFCCSVGPLEEVSTQTGELYLHLKVPNVASKLLPLCKTFDVWKTPFKRSFLRNPVPKICAGSEDVARVWFWSQQCKK